jgi:crotonobetainyl-CoA:carnitine CoA-transferase CaiB-like acyl-CoA transferase
MQVLQDVRVVSIATNLPGPLAVARLRALGATVHKIEPPAGDLLERANPEWYRQLHQGMTIERLDLKNAAERARIDPLLARADLLVTATRPTSLERLRLGWPHLHETYPRLSQVAVVGNPAPEEDLPGHDLAYQAERGLVRPPHMPSTLLADLGGAQEVVITALQLLWAARTGALGSRVAVSLSASAAWFAEPLRRGLTSPGGHLGGGFAGYGLYQTSDGWVAVAALEAHFQTALAAGLGIARLTHDSLQRVFATRTADDWVALARSRDLPLVKVIE